MEETKIVTEEEPKIQPVLEKEKIEALLDSEKVAGLIVYAFTKTGELHHASVISADYMNTPYKAYVYACAELGAKSMQEYTDGIVQAFESLASKFAKKEENKKPVQQ